MKISRLLFPLAIQKEELEYAKTFQGAITELDREGLKTMISQLADKERRKEMQEMPLLDFVIDKDMGVGGGGSTDVGDVSWVVPTAQVNVNCYAAGERRFIPGRRWRRGKSSIAHKGMLTAAKVMACSGAKLLLDPQIIERAKEDWKDELDGETYPNPLPKDAKPEIW